MAEQARILVVDDEPAVQSALSRALALERYDVAQAVDGREALERLGAAPYEAVILDISMPHMDGLEVCRRLREGGDRTPVLMLTAREEVDDRVAGLDAGADDYLVKPFALRELLARVRALLRRAGEEDEQEETLAFEDLRLDRLAHEAWRGERLLQLTRTEFLLLEMFLRHPRQVLTRSAIFEHVWGYDFGSTSNSLGVYMGYLRRKTEVGDEPRLLHTVRGVGYVLRGHERPAMSFRRRITLVSAAAVAVAVVLASVSPTCSPPTSCAARSTRSCATAPTACASSRAAPTRRSRSDAAATSSKARTPEQAPRQAARAAEQHAEQPPAQPAAAARPGARLPAARRRRTAACCSARRNVTLPVDARTRALAAGSGRALLPRRPRQRHPPAHPRRAHRAPGAPCRSPSRSPKSTTCCAACA